MTFRLIPRTAATLRPRSPSPASGPFAAREYAYIRPRTTVGPGPRHRRHHRRSRTRRTERRMLGAVGGRWLLVTGGDGDRGGREDRGRRPARVAVTGGPVSRQTESPATGAGLLRASRICRRRACSAISPQTVQRQLESVFTSSWRSTADSITPLPCDETCPSQERQSRALQSSCGYRAL